MGKEQKLEAPGSAFSRMNYLYQAAHLMTNLSLTNPLSNYYNKMMKEISKKIVEKLHPDLKRTICVACNYPLTAGKNHINVKLKTQRKKQKRQKQNKNMTSSENTKKISIKNISDAKYTKSRVEARNKRPNKIWWSCSKCNFRKGFLLQPNYKLWIYKCQDRE